MFLFGIFENIKQSNLFVENANFPLVVKADGLASGKGVYICENKDEAKNAIKEIFSGKYGNTKKQNRLVVSLYIKVKNNDVNL